MPLGEPLAGSNATEKAEVADKIEMLKADNVSILLVEHDMRSVMRLCDRIDPREVSCATLPIRSISRAGARNGPAGPRCVSPGSRRLKTSLICRSLARCAIWRTMCRSRERISLLRRRT